jgi:hypothetical protein
LDAEHVIAEAKALRETSAALRKDARQLCDTAGLVRAEAEAERQKKRNGTKAPEDEKEVATRTLGA